ncbi:TetR family transcriptional regulator [Roseibium aquae]|uniref:TetR family transcriptional regulator n=1 Tax=Roseibium aquae TaxID=1323746 RepID=A0A916TMH1_9HYPH|nr:TetR/AcrR family transcriptional regulator [Roseibium aquae]GGB56305.1 TetR family transcriptional regulator [Roseibium aquae]
MRKQPKQQRARQTLDHFYEATAQLLQSGESNTVTTNHIADRAGFSIGTLYRYFPNKRAILHGLAMREMERQEAAALAMLEASEGTTGRELVRQLIDFHLNAFGGRSRTRRRMILNMINDRDATKLIVRAQRGQVRLLRLLQDMLAAREPDRYRKLTDSQLHIVSAGLSGAIRVSVLTAPEILEDSCFGRDLSDLVERSFLRLADADTLADIGSHASSSG